MIGASIAYAAATVSTRQKARADAAIRRHAEIAHAWDRFVWLMQNRNTLAKPVILSLLERIAVTAFASGDGDLTAFCRQVAHEMLQAAHQVDATPWTEASGGTDNHSIDEGA